MRACGCARLLSWVRQPAGEASSSARLSVARGQPTGCVVCKLPLRRIGTRAAVWPASLQSRRRCHLPATLGIDYSLAVAGQHGTVAIINTLTVEHTEHLFFFLLFFSVLARSCVLDNLTQQGQT